MLDEHQPRAGSARRSYIVAFVIGVVIFGAIAGVGVHQQSQDTYTRTQRANGTEWARSYAATQTAVAWTTLPSTRGMTTLHSQSSGNLACDSGSGNLSLSWTDPNNSRSDEISSFYVDVTFTNPSATSWSYAFLFRHTGTNQQYRLIFGSSGRWQIAYGNADDSTIDSGTPSAFRTGAGQTNRIRVLARGAQGALFINDTFIRVLDLSFRTGSGEFGIACGLYSGEGTRYTLIYGPYTVYSP